MPDIVDPFSARFVRHGLRIDAIGRETLLEYRVREAKICAQAVVEGVVGVRDVVVPPPELRRVEGDDAGREPGLVGAGEQRDCQLVVVRLVQLEEARGFAVRGADVLDRLAAGGGQAVGQIELFGDFGDGQLAGWVVDLVDADGREADGRGDFVTEDRGGGVAGVGVDEHARDDAVAVKCLTIGKVGG